MNISEIFPAKIEEYVLRKYAHFVPLDSWGGRDFFAKPNSLLLCAANSCGAGVRDIMGK